MKSKKLGTQGRRAFLQGYAFALAGVLNESNVSEVKSSLQLCGLTTFKSLSDVGVDSYSIEILGPVVRQIELDGDSLTRLTGDVANFMKTGSAS